MIYALLAFFVLSGHLAKNLIRILNDFTERMHWKLPRWITNIMEDSDFSGGPLHNIFELFWSNYPNPKDKTEFRKAVLEGIRYRVELDIQKLAKELEVNIELPKPPKGYFWREERGGVKFASDLSVTFRLWSHELGYFPSHD